MAEIDYTTRIADRAASLLKRIDDKLRAKVFLGPGVVRLSPKEALARLAALSPDERLALLQEHGRDDFMAYLEGLLDQGGANARPVVS